MLRKRRRSLIIANGCDIHPLLLKQDLLHPDTQNQRERDKVHKTSKSSLGKAPLLEVKRSRWSFRVLQKKQARDGGLKGLNEVTKSEDRIIHLFNRKKHERKLMLPYQKKEVLLN